MNEKDVKRDAEQFCDAWQGLNSIYDDYARTQEMSYTNLYILSLLSRMEVCTQKTICERTLLPKQTVNTIITSFYKSQMVELRELPEDRRTKTIHLTDKGSRIAAQSTDHIKEAEIRAMQQLTDEQKKALLDGMRIYCNAFRKEMLSDK